MQMPRCLLCLLFVSGALHSAWAETISVERSRLFALSPGDVIEDSGVITVDSARFGRTEAFEVVRHSNGGRTVTSVITGTSQPFRVEGRWVYDAEDRPLSAKGEGIYNGSPAAIQITAKESSAEIVVTSGGETTTTKAACAAMCLIDMAPSVMAMFTMTRRVPHGSSEPVRFYWIGQGLTFNQTLTTGLADIYEVKSQRVGDTDIIQYLFVETLPNLETGGTSTIAFNLYADTDQRPLVFATQGGTIGARSGYETLTTSMPPVFEAQ